jgi:hypothetical protein
MLDALSRCVRLRGEMKKPCEGVEEGKRERQKEI